jgi:predicted AAA+ superfamily ATPase
MIQRTLAPKLRAIADLYPVVVVTGPRQSGKTTLCRATFPDLPYVSLEPLDAREFARTDPRGFLRQHGAGAVIDEVQNAPDLLSYLQADVDDNPTAGRFILTGSQHFGLSHTVSQSLAGRAGMLELLPPSLEELRRFPTAPSDLFTTLWSGSYPRIFDRGIPAQRWLADYVTTYVERDVRHVLRVGDLSTFAIFIRLCAGRTAQESNLTDVGADAGVSHVTARAWLSVLESSYLCFRVPAWHRNLRKRLVKSAKLHFVDTGLVCYLLGIRDPEQLATHPLRGAIFETWVAAEVYKQRVHQGLPPALHHLRAARGDEIDLVVEGGERLVLVEAKSGATASTDAITRLARLAAAVTAAGEGDRRPVEARVVFGGDRAQDRSDVAVVPWAEMPLNAWD